MQLFDALALCVLTAAVGLGLAATTATTTTTSSTDICHCTTTTLSSSTLTRRTSTSTSAAATTTSTSTTMPSTTLPSSNSTTSDIDDVNTTTSTNTTTTSTTTTTTGVSTTLTTVASSTSTTISSTTTSTTTTTTMSSSTTSTSTRTTTTTCPPCGYFTEGSKNLPTGGAGVSSGFVCGTDCASLSWDFVSPMILMSVMFWAGELVGGISLAFYSFTSNIDDTKESVEVWLGKLQSSQFYIVLTMILATLQCIIFSYRTFSKSVLIVEYVIELLAVTIFSVNQALSWMRAYFKGVMAGVIYTFTWGMVDALLIPSVVCLCLLEVNGAKSWFSLSFVASAHIVESWRLWVELKRLDLRVLKWQAWDVTLPCLVIVYTSGMMMMWLENVGDPEWLQDLNEDKWTVISSLYFVFVTITTVGYGDLAPVTTLGRLFAIIAIFGGISAFLHAINKVLEVMNLHSAGGGHFTPRIRVRHIVVTGNPTIGMATDFILELFHPDHAEDAEDLHLVFMLPRGSASLHAVLRFLRRRANLHIAPRVHVLQGSVLVRSDLQRVCPHLASAFFVLPSIQCMDQMHEDTENIIRMMAVLKAAPKVRMILLLMKAEHEQLLHDTGVGDLSANLTCLAMDQFKFELVGKSCMVPGFATMICNLFKTIADADEDDPIVKQPGMAWLGDYDDGCGNELYEVELSQTYSQRDAVFSEVVLDVIEQTDGKVYLIGLVETGLGQKRVLVNPGTFYPIKNIKQGVQTSGIFIAADRDCVIQCDGGVFLGRRERPTDGKPRNKGTEESEEIVLRNDDTSRPATAKSTASSEGDRAKEKRSGNENGKDSAKHAEKKKGAGSEYGPASKQGSSGKTPGNGDQSASSGKELVPVSPPSGAAAPPPPQSAPTSPKNVPMSSRSKAIAAEQARLNSARQKQEAAALQAAVRKEEENQRTALTILTLTQQQRKALQPHRPPLKLLARGGHVLFLCVGTQPGDELRLGVEHFLRPMRLASAEVELPLVVLAPVPPRDWHRVSEAKQVYFLKGSPLSIFDLERANFRACSVIFVCHVGSPQGMLTEEWQVDSEVICCLRLIESEIPWGSPISIIVEVTVDTNHSFVALTTQPPGTGQDDTGITSKLSRRQSRMEDSIQKLRGMRTAQVGIQAASAPSAHLHAAEHYRQPRFACGQLFVGNVVTSLVVNSFYNPSLWELIHTMIASQVVMVPVPKLWEGKSYYEYFDYLLRQQELMPVAIYRLAEVPPKGFMATTMQQPRKWSYVFTAPPAKETHMVRDDKVICFGVGAGGMRKTEALLPP